MSSQSFPRMLAAELVGTYIFVFVGAGGVVTSSHFAPSMGLLIAAFANGVGLGVAVSLTMGVSGGHLNPAVTLGMLATRRINVARAVGYIVAQVVGATLAGYTLVLLVPHEVGSAANYGAPSLGLGVSVGVGIAFEAVMTFVLVSAVFGTAVDPRAPKIGGFGIGLAVFLDVLTGGPFTGAMMNPARAIGPEIAAHYFSAWYVYWVGPIIGSVVAALIYQYVIMGGQRVEGSK
ncbi:MAG: aquaporin [Thermoprotei archaeon]